MTITLRKVVTTLIFAFTTLVFVLFILFDTYTWGKYVFFGLSVCILLLGSVISHGEIMPRFSPYIVLNILFIGFTLCSSLWAFDTSDSMLMARTLIQIFLCAYAVYITYLNIPELDATVLIKAVMWAGYIVAIYALSFYGLDKMMAAGRKSNLRIENDFANVNTIGMACALSCVLQINLRNLRPQERIFPSALFMIPSAVVIAATQSRKAFVFFVVGALGYAFVKAQKSNKGLFIKVVKTLFWILILALILYWILRLNAFDGARKRMEYMLNTVLNKGKIDHSTILRNNLKELGLRWFVQYPIGGIGIANPHILAMQYYNFDAYLHNNFVELLCGGGIIGFCLYYAMYFCLFKQLWKYRNIDKQRVAFFALWLGLMLAMNYGMVTYYSKSQNFYLMIHFVNVFDLKRKALKLCRTKNTLTQ